MSHSRKEDHSPLESSLVKRRLEAANVPPKFKAQQQRSTFGLVGRLLKAIRGYTIDDIGRLKEAGVGMVEAETKIKESTALKNLAEAERMYAEVEEKRIENSIKEAELQKLQAEARLVNAETSKTEAETVGIKNKIREVALSRLLQAVSQIRQQGGDVMLDRKQLEKLLLEQPKGEEKT